MYKSATQRLFHSSIPPWPKKFNSHFYTAVTIMYKDILLNDYRSVLSKNLSIFVAFKKNLQMKNIKTLCALTAVVLFTACYNPGSSTSQERSEETTTTEHGEEAHGGEHDAMQGKTAPMHTDSTLHSNEAMHTDSTMHTDSVKHK